MHCYLFRYHLLLYHIFTIREIRKRSDYSIPYLFNTISPPFTIIFIFKLSSKIIKSASLPSRMLPHSLSKPNDCAGVNVHALTASSNGMCICSTAVLSQSCKFDAEPAIVPSSRVATFPTTLTACPPSEYSPSFIPVAIILSLIIQILSAPNSEKAARTIDG